LYSKKRRLGEDKNSDFKRDEHIWSTFARWAVCPLTLTQRPEFMHSTENAIGKLGQIKAVMTREGKLMEFASSN